MDIYPMDDHLDARSLQTIYMLCYPMRCLSELQVVFGQRREIVHVNSSLQTSDNDDNLLLWEHISCPAPSQTRKNN